MNDVDSAWGERLQWMAHAASGDFAAAWRISDRALERHVAAPDVNRPRHAQAVWRGQPIARQRVLIRCYRGLGDALQFIRYAPLVRAVAREVSVWAPESLMSLVRTVEGVDVALPLHDGVPDIPYDVDVEIMELPYVFRTTLDTVPRCTPYLSVAPATLPTNPPAVGLFWRGGESDRRRWLPFSEVMRLLAVDGVTWCSLQRSCQPDEDDQRLVRLGHGNLTDLARRIAQLDLVITIDSMPAHLAGALGVPVWTLLRKEADWRWLRDRCDTPWYPTMRLFRQDVDGCWRGVIDKVRRRLHACVQSRPAPLLVAERDLVSAGGLPVQPHPIQRRLRRGHEERALGLRAQWPGSVNHAGPEPHPLS